MYRNLTLSLLLLLAFNSSSLFAQCVDDLLIDFQQTSHTIFFEASFAPVEAKVELSYFWDLGDGTTSNIASPVHTYDNAGTYEACVTVTTTVNGESCSVESCEMITVEFSLPCVVTAAFEWIDAGFGEVVVQELCETNSFTSVTSISWESSEGEVETGAQASMNFEDLTSTEVCLTVQAISQGNECASVLCKTVELEIPELEFAPEMVIKENDGCEFRFINTSDVGELEDVTFEWIADGEVVEDETQPLIQFDENGTHEVCLNATVPWYGELRVVSSCVEVSSFCAEEMNDGVQVAHSFDMVDQLRYDSKVSVHIVSGNLTIKSASNEAIDELLQYRIYDLRGSLLKEGTMTNGESLPLNGVNAQLIVVEIVGSTFRQVEKLQLLN